MINFTYYPNRDKGELYLKTLEESGLYHQVPRATGADFLLSDYEGRCPTDIAAMLKRNKCVFIYPHAALTFISYDGMYPSNQNITANFVPSTGQRKVMWGYGYKCPVYPIGWSYSPVLPFKPGPRKVTKILFAPNHSIKDSRKRFASHYWDKRWEQNEETFLRLREIPDSTITVYHAGDPWADNNIRQVINNVEYIKSDLSVKKSVEIIGSGQYDLVVAFDTFAWISVAMGVPTLMFGLDLQWEGILGKAKNWNNYKDLLRYPYDILDPKFSMNKYFEMLETDEKIKLWKDEFIGKPFDKELFLSIVKTKLSEAQTNSSTL